MSATKRLNPLDWFFLAAESSESMMHVGSLAPFSPPPDAPKDFLRRLMEEIKDEAHAYPPWSLKLKNPGFIASPLQAWVEDKQFDVEYHVRRSALPSPGDERELGILVSRLHSNKIDFHRPPWEVHFIEGLEGGRFAIYFKVHHALVDGYTGAKLMERGLSTNPNTRDEPLFYARKPPERVERAAEASAPTLEALMSLAREQAGATRNIAGSFLRILKPAKGKPKTLVAPMSAPRSILNQKISRNRRFATQQFPVERLKRAAKAYDGTLNDIVLALCAHGLRKLLGELGELPPKPLNAMLPVNIRPKDDPGGGNAVGSILATLATDVEDPAERFRAIIASTTAAKAQLSGMTKMGIMEYSAL
ncbi:MAG TPA: wax ester/triacylglycerol synthase family O-acyltransferase, partial [Nevskiaceae bacterium]|nr:wax ester/triacylglycerol synthase family O-acyltransferase [Nevskiaceae bacterium]